MNPENLNLHRLRAFQLVAEHGSLREAGARLGLTVSAVSFALKRLESDIGVQLFQRFPNRLVLTPAGDNLAVASEGIFRGIESTLSTLRSQPAGTSRLAISISNDLSNYIAPRLGLFAERFPSVILNIFVYRSQDALGMVSRGELDLAIGRFDDRKTGQPAELYKTLEIEPVVETTFSIIFPRGDPLSLNKGPLILDDLSRRPLIMLPQGSSARRLIDSAFEAASVRPRACLEAGNCQTIQVYAERGLGVGLVHSICLQPTPRMVSVEVSPQFSSMRFSAAYRRASVTGMGPSAVLLGMLEVLLSQ